MESAIKRSKASSKQRAFQSLPRFLRRRAASHNVKRVPHRIRENSKKEMAIDNNKISKKSSVRGHEKAKIMAAERALQNSSRKDLKPNDNTGLNKQAERPQSTNNKYAKRQASKIWLPTHVWHAKRAHMTEEWTYSIPKSPTQKCYRATHRVFSAATAISWDTSYYGSIVLLGAAENLISVIEKMFGPGAVKQAIITGQKSWEGILSYQCISYGPTLIYWSNSSQVLIYLHPGIFDSVFHLLQSEQEEFKFDINDCRFSLGSISLTGSKALFALTSLLRSRNGDSIVNTLKGLANVDSLPSQIALTMEVNDPRFYNAHNVSNDFKYSGGALDWFAYKPEPTTLLTVEGRQKSYENQESIKTLNERRSKTKPGEPIEIRKTDPSIPILLLKRKDDSLTVILPWHWVMPFWYSLQQIDGVRFGGLNQIHQLKFEQKRPFFPDDYPNTMCGFTTEQRKNQEFLNTWNRKPVAKRVNYSAIKINGLELGELGDFSKCDWKYLAELNNVPLDELLEKRLTMIHIKYLNRGRPHDRARIYSIAEADVEKWKSLPDKDDELDDITYPECPSKQNLIGFVTTGDFNLQQGCGSGIGSITNASSQFILVRNIGTNIARLAKWHKTE